MNRWIAASCCLVLLGACGASSDPQEVADVTVSTNGPAEDANSIPTDTGSVPTDAGATTTVEADDVVVVAITTPACDLVTAAEVAAATGFEVIDVIDQPPLGCVFDLGEEVGIDIWVAADDGEGRLAGPASVFADYTSRLSGPNARTVEDVGDAAVFDSAYRALAVDAGGGRFLLFAINGGYQALDEPLGELTSIAQAALARI